MVLKWCTKDGFSVILRDCEGTRFVLDVDFDNEEKWVNLVKNQKSRVLLRCSSCHYVAETTVGRFHFFKTAGCFCSGKPVFRTRSAQQIFLSKLDKTQFFVVDEIRSFDWWASQKITTNTSIPVTCRICEMETTIANIGKFVGTEVLPQCWCHSRSAPYATEAGRLHILKRLAQTRFKPLPWMESQTEWHQRQQGAHSYIGIQCEICGDEPDKCTISNFLRTGSALCWCSSSKKYADESGRRRILQILSETRFVPASWMLSESEWLARNMCSTSCLELTCPLCNSTTSTCNLAHFVANQSVDCMCRWKTQRRVWEWLQSIVNSSEYTVEREKALPGCKSALGGTMPYDIAICKGTNTVLLIEVDGEQHFQPGRFGSSNEKFQRTLMNDLQKEVDAVSRGIPLARMYQDDVWTNKFKWKSWLTTLITEACEGSIEVAVHRQPNKVAYTSGEYALRRVGSTVPV